MPTQKRGHEDADDNHVKASEDIPRPKKLRKRPVEISSDEQKEPLDDPWLKKCQASDIPRPKKLRKNPIEKSSDEQKEPLDDPTLEKCQASKDIPRPKILQKNLVEKSGDAHKEPLDDPRLEKYQASEDIPRKNSVEKSSDEQKEPLDDPRLEKCQISEDIPRPKKLRKNPVVKSSDEQKGPLDDPKLEKDQASENISGPKILRKKPVEKSSDEQKEPLDDPIAETLCQTARFVPAKQTKNLSKLPYELLVEIAMRLKLLEDFTCFRSVSKSLHLSVKDEYFEGLPFRKSLPYLMLPPVSSSSDRNDDIRRQFYSLVEGESIVASLEVPTFKTSTKMCFESLGWLLTVEVDGSMSLLDPFSNIEIPLPHMYTYPRTELMTYDERFIITKMVLSSRPNETTDFILMIIFGDCYHLAFWRLGDKAWNMIDDQRRGNRNVLYVGGEQFYAINSSGIIWAINLAAGHVELRDIMNCMHILHVNNCQGQYLLKSINGSLLGVTRSRDNKFFLTSEFRVYDIDIKTGKSRELYSLGNMAIFLGRNSSFAVDATATASNGGGIKANHIYFTDDFGECQRIYFEDGDRWRSFSGGSRYKKGGSVDCGVFNFETGDIEPVYPVKPLMSNVCPAMWITPNLSKLPYELQVEVAMRRKKLEDFTCFRSVSRSFHLNVKEEYFEGPRFRKSLPYLMLPPVSSSWDGNDDIQRRQFYSLVEGESMVASLEVPAFRTISKMCFESLGWLLTVEVDGSMSLLDPFSDIEIPLPHMYTFPGTELITYDKRFLIKKMVLSSRPNESADFFLMIIIGDCNHLAFWRLGDKAWNKIDVEDKAWNKIDFEKPCLNDVVYVGGEQFYAVSARGIIWAVNLADRCVELCNIASCVGILRIDHTQGQYILKSINGSLLGVKRSRDKKFFLTSEFRVYDIDITTGLKREIYSLGNMAIFLGRNSSFAVDATDTASNGGEVIKANHIYFTDDFGEYQRIYFEGGDQWRSFSGGSRFAKGGSVDSGVFNFETGEIEAIYPVKPLLSNVCPAMWITPNL